MFIFWWRHTPPVEIVSHGWVRRQARQKSNDFMNTHPPTDESMPPSDPRFVAFIGRRYEETTRAAWGQMIDWAGWFRIGTLSGTNKGVSNSLTVYTSSAVYEIRAMPDPVSGEPRLTIEEIKAKDSR